LVSRSSQLILPGGDNVRPQEFVDLLRPHAQAVERRTGIPWQVIVAQAALETGWLKHPIVDADTGEPSYNLFGIKAHGREYVNAWTHEYIRGERVRVKDKFRKYASYEESLADYANFLLSNPRYRIALQHSDPVKFA